MSYVLDLSGRTAFVTGAASGIGAAICRAMREAGAEVIAADRNGSVGRALAEDIGAEFVELDVTDSGAVRAALGGKEIDILVNNAGVDQGSFFTDSGEAEWQSLLNVNLAAVLTTTHAVLPGMQARGWGRIIAISSEAARRGSKGGAVYAAAKAGVIGFTKSIAREAARYGVTANAICPGPIRTPLLEAALERGGDAARRAMTEFTLLRRLGEPAEVAAAAVFLASERAAFITGETLGVSGGMGV